MVVCPDSAVHYVEEWSQQKPPCQCEAYNSFCAVTQFLFWCLLPVAPCRYCILSLSVPQLDPFLSHIYSLPFCLFPRVHRGHRTIAATQPLHTSCAGWHHRDGSAHVAPCCCRVHLEGRDNRELKHSTKCIGRPRPYLFICLWPSGSNLHWSIQDNLEDDKNYCCNCKVFFNV